eukprot:gene34005-41150_t
MHRLRRLSGFAVLPTKTQRSVWARPLSIFGSHHHQDANVIRKMSIEDPVKFWREAAQDIEWITPPTKVLDVGPHGYGRWFQD